MMMTIANMSSKLEINLKRLLSRCEKIASDKSTWDWRLEKYVEALHEQLGDLKRSTSKPAQEVLTEYSRRIEFLKGLLEAESMPTSSEKALASERLAPVTHATSASIMPKEIHLQTKSRHVKDMRTQLLGDSTSTAGSGEGVRQRKPQEEEDIDAILQHHHKMHERLAEELLHHTRNLKEFAYSSNAIVKKDVQKVTDTTRQADTNYADLQRESQRLEAKTKSCNWWIWIMLIFVTLIFLWMVVLMRIFPKS